MRIYLIYDSGNPEQNMEQLKGFMSESAAKAACERENARDYPDVPLDEAGDGEADHWAWIYVDVEPES